MATLSDQDRVDLWAEFMRDRANLPPTLLKPDLRAAVNAVDQWADDNASAFNLAIPQPARGLLSARQKAALLMYVLTRRFEVTP